MRVSSVRGEGVEDESTRNRRVPRIGRGDRTYDLGNCVDLTHELSDGMPVYPGNPVPSFKRVKTLQTDGVNISEFLLGSHTGTHIDAPVHFIENGTSIDQIPVSHFIGEAYVADLTNVPIGGGITSRELEPYLGAEGADPDTAANKRKEKKMMKQQQQLEERQQLVGRDDILLCFTGCSELWGEERVTTDYTYLTEDAAELLVHSGIRGVGIDSSSVEQFGSKNHATHKVLLGGSIFIIEALSDAIKLFLGQRVLIVATPIKVKDADGAPARVIAIPQQGEHVYM